MTYKFRPFLPILILFVIVNALAVAGSSTMGNWGMDQSVLIYGNLILLAATFFSFLFAVRGLNSNNPHAFVRSIMGSIMIKMVICMAAAIVYIMSFRDNLNKPALFTCMGLYLIYTFIEVGILTKLAKEKKNV